MKRAKSPEAAPRHLAAGVSTACSWAYAIAIVAVWLILWRGGERWWFATVLLYGPRWVWTVPLALLVPAAASLRAARAAFPLALASALVAGPVMGFCIPWSGLVRGEGDGRTIRILSCNTEGEDLDVEALAELIVMTWPDVVMLQEWSARDPLALFRQEGWDIRVDRGLCFASRYPIRAHEALSEDQLGGRGGAALYLIETPDGTITCANLHLSTPREGLQAVLDDHNSGPERLRENTRMRWQVSDVASGWVGDAPAPLLIAGDFNLPADSAIFRRYWSGYADAFAEVGLGLGHSKFTGWFGIRIDHILAGPSWQFRRCWVGPDVGSDHRPVVADVEAAASMSPDSRVE